NSAVGVILNSLLLHLIKRFSRKDLGAYKTLLTAFSGFDIFLCFAHWLISPRAIVFDTTFSIVAHSFWEHEQITLVFVSIFTVPFGIMNINFLSRFWAIRNPKMLLIFTNKYFKLVLFLYAFSAYWAWHLLSWWDATGESDEVGIVIAREIYREKYNLTIMDGWLLMDHWRDGQFNFRAAVLFAAVDSIMIVSF
ncbi:hypothetical protein PFISCL1PPCAC_18657, partial [Pristionchus fissidentatus]